MSEVEDGGTVKTPGCIKKRYLQPETEGTDVPSSVTLDGVQS